MAVLLNNVTLPVRHTEEMLRKKVAKLLHLSLRELGEIEIVRRSIDARKKPELFYVYLLRLCLPKEERFRKLPNVTQDTGRSLCGTHARRGGVSAHPLGARSARRRAKGNCRCVLGGRTVKSGLQCLLRRGRGRYLFRRKIEYARQGQCRAEPESAGALLPLRRGQLDSL